MILHRKKLNPLFLLIIIAAMVFIASDLTINFAGKKGVWFINNSAVLTALSGLFFILLTLLYYLIKKIHFALMKRKHLKPVVRSLSWHVVYIYRKVHPFIGAAALAVLSVHGYLYFIRIYDFYTDILILSGAAALLSFFTVAALGIALFRNPHSIILRRIHKAAAVLTIMLIAAHIAIGR